MRLSSQAAGPSAASPRAGTDGPSNADGGSAGPRDPASRRPATEQAAVRPPLPEPRNRREETTYHIAGATACGPQGPAVGTEDEGAALLAPSRPTPRGDGLVPRTSGFPGEAGPDGNSGGRKTGQGRAPLAALLKSPSGSEALEPQTTAPPTGSERSLRARGRWTGPARTRGEAWPWVAGRKGRGQPRAPHVIGLGGGRPAPTSAHLPLQVCAPRRTRATQAPSSRRLLLQNQPETRTVSSTAGIV